MEAESLDCVTHSVVARRAVTDSGQVVTVISIVSTTVDVFWPQITVVDGTTEFSGTSAVDKGTSGAAVGIF